MFNTKELIRHIRPTLVSVAAGATLALVGNTAANAQSSLADFSQTDTTAFQFTNNGAASTFAVSGAAFDFNYGGSVYHTTLDITSGVSGPATSDPISGSSGTGTVSENLSNISLQFISTTTHASVLSLSNGTGILYGILDDPTDASSNISVAGLSTMRGNWSSSLIPIDTTAHSSLTIGGITPTAAVSLQSNGHISSFSTSGGGVTGGFEARPVPEAGTLLSLGGMVLSSGAVAGRRLLGNSRATRRTPAAA